MTARLRDLVGTAVDLTVRDRYPEGSCVTAVDRFLMQRGEHSNPHWNPTEVAFVQSWCEQEGIPFCWSCGDWHQPGEDHSMVGAS